MLILLTGDVYKRQVSPYVSQNLGAKKIERIKKGYHAALVLDLCFAVLAFIAVSYTHLSHSAPVQKITIIPRTSGALGYTMQVEQGDKYLMTKEEIENKIATFTAVSYTHLGKIHKKNCQIRSTSGFQTFPYSG